MFVLGTERNENRRIDNQLRGRSGRQGDPGASKFFISLEDDLMRIFGPNLKMLEYSLRKTDQSDNDPITHPWLTRSIEKAQQRVEAQHFDTRKHLLKYADVLNAQRTAVYDERRDLMHSADVHDRVLHITECVIHDVVQVALDQKKSSDRWDWDFLIQEFSSIFGLTIDFDESDRQSADRAVKKVQQLVIEKMAQLDESWGTEMRIRMEKSLILKLLDQTWIAHLNAMDHLRSGIHLQAYGQKDPLNEYRHEAFVLFKSMKNQWYRNFLTMYFHANPQHLDAYEDEDEDMEELLKKWSYQHASLTEEDADGPETESPSEETMRLDYRKILDELLSRDKADGSFNSSEDWDYIWSSAEEEVGKDRTKKMDQKNRGQKTRGHKTGGQSEKPKKSGTPNQGSLDRSGLSAKRTPGVTRTKPSDGRGMEGASGKAEKKNATVGMGKSSNTRGLKTMGVREQLGRSKVQSGKGSVKNSKVLSDDFKNESWGAMTKERAKTKEIKRRAPSKRGHYVPKNVPDQDILQAVSEYTARHNRAKPSATAHRVRRDDRPFEKGRDYSHSPTNQSRSQTLHASHSGRGHTEGGDHRGVSSRGKSQRSSEHRHKEGTLAEKFYSSRSGERGEGRKDYSSRSGERGEGRKDYASRSGERGEGRKEQRGTTVRQGSEGARESVRHRTRESSGRTAAPHSMGRLEHAGSKDSKTKPVRSMRPQNPKKQ